MHLKKIEAAGCIYTASYGETFIYIYVEGPAGKMASRLRSVLSKSDTEKSIQNITWQRKKLTAYKDVSKLEWPSQHRILELQTSKKLTPNQIDRLLQAVANVM